MLENIMIIWLWVCGSSLTYYVAVDLGEWENMVFFKRAVCLVFWPILVTLFFLEIRVKT